MFLSAIDLARDELGQAMGLLFTLSTVALFVSLGDGGLLDANRLGGAALALSPTMAGMVMGRRLRAASTEAAFRRTTVISPVMLKV